MRLAVLSDTHFHHDRSAAIGIRRAGIADILLLRAVHRLNRFIRPDATVILGDIVNDGALPEAPAQFQTMRRTLDLLTMPWVVIPGNHDADPEAFYRHFPRPPEWLDVAGVRLLSFVDPEEPRYNASRRDADVQRLRAARNDGWRGQVVTLQHVPLFPPGAHPCPYNYLNAQAILDAMAETGISAAISGHYHTGFGPLRHGAIDLVAAPALCEAPFPYLILEIDAQGVRLERQTLAMPAELGLVDTHVHTHLAYCQENMEIGLAQALARDFGLAGLRFTEHSGHLAFSRKRYGHTCFQGGLAEAQPAENRMEEYLQALRRHGIAPATWGIEVDADYRGDWIVPPDAMAALPFCIGAVHGLQTLQRGETDEARLADDFLNVLQRFLRPPMAALAHPFRVFRRARRPTPAGLYEATLRLLKERGVAAEINLHTNEPDPEWIRRCIEAGVPLTFGSDAHNLYEVGEFFPHLDLLRRAGFDGNPRDVLLSPA